jgi:hypothetical protein
MVQLCAGMGDTFQTPSSTIEFHLGTAPAAIAFCRVAATQNRPGWEAFLPIFWALSRQRARPRALRSLVPWGDKLDQRVLLDAGVAGSRAPSALVAKEDAKKPKPPNLAPFASLANAIIKEREEPFIPSQADLKLDRTAIELALYDARVKPIPGAQAKVMADTIETFDDGGGQLALASFTDHHKLYTVQVIFSPSGPISSTYVARTTNPEQIVLFPASQPVNVSRLQTDLLGDFQGYGLTFGPVNANTFVTDAVAALNSKGLLPAEAANVVSSLTGYYGSSGSQLSILWQITIQTGPNEGFGLFVEGLLNADGTFQFDTNQAPYLYPAPDPIPIIDPPPPGSPFTA